MLWTFWSVRQRVVCQVSDGSVRYGGLIDAESELHALDSSTSVLVDLAVAFLFGGPLPDHVGGVVSFEVWCGELLYAPGGWLGTRVGIFFVTIFTNSDTKVFIIPVAYVFTVTVTYDLRQHRLHRHRLHHLLHRGDDPVVESFGLRVPDVSSSRRVVVRRGFVDVTVEIKVGMESESVVVPSKVRLHHLRLCHQCLPAPQT